MRVAIHGALALSLVAMPDFAEGQTTALCGGVHVPEAVTLGPGPDLRAVSLRGLREDFYRVGRSVLLEDGSAVVSNGGSNELLAFDSNGRLQWRSGGSGDGPAEFRLLGGVRRIDSTLVAFDAQYGVKRFGQDGHHLGGTRLNADVRGSVRDAFYLGDVLIVVRQRTERATGKGVVLPRWVTVSRLQGDEDVDLGSWPGGAQLNLPLPNGGFSSLSRPLSVAFWAEPLGAQCFVTAAPTGSGVSVLDVTGRVLSTVAIPSVAVHLTAEEWERAIADRLESSGHGNEWDFSVVPKPATRPAWRTVIPGPEGILWAEPFRGARGPLEAIARLDLRSGMIQWVRVPGGTSRLLAATDSLLLIVRQDDFDVEHVEVAVVR